MYMLKKGMKWLNQYCWLAKVTNGVSARFMQRYYLSVAVPMMMYAADIFLIPAGCHCKGTKGFINKLARVQRQAALAITGALATTATDSPDAHANLLPFQLLMVKPVHRATICTTCLPKNHPLVEHIVVAAKQNRKHRSPLHKIMQAFDIKPARMEKIETVYGFP